MYDTIIIGSGPSGVSAAVYLKRSGFDVLVLSTNDSALKKAKIIENYYGFPEITGKELYDLGIKQLEHLNIPFDITEVLNIKSDYQTTPKFTIETTSDSFFAKSIILATGTSRSIPMISNIKDYIDTKNTEGMFDEEKISLEQNADVKMKASLLDNYLSKTYGLNIELPINVFSHGNAKLPKDTLIVNFSAALQCPASPATVPG